MSPTREEKEAAARARMAELAAKFVARSYGELGAMRECFARFATGDTQALEEIRHIAHRMGGTGATLGFETLADCAMCVERLAEIRAPDSILVATANMQLATAIDALNVELGRLKGT